MLKDFLAYRVRPCWGCLAPRDFVYEDSARKVPEGLKVD
jgi:hypothetical protein